MQDGSSFFGSGGGLIARPPKRVTPANRGSNNSRIFSGRNAVPSRVAAGTYMYLPQGGYGYIGYLRSATTGNAIANIDARDVAGLNASYAEWCQGSFVYDSVGGFWYGLAKDNGTQIALVKYNDTTGARSVVGSLFTVTNKQDWQGGHAYLSGSNLKYIAPAYSGGLLAVHTVDIGTGALVSQAQPFTLSDGTVVPYMDVVHYITADNSAVIGFNPRPGSGGTASSLLSACFAKSGVVVSGYDNYSYPQDGVGIDGRLIYNGECLCMSVPGGTASLGWRYYDRTDFDRYVKAIIKAAAGV